MTDIIQSEFFDPIIPYIRRIEPSINYLEIEIPSGLTVDVDVCRKYFCDDATLYYVRGESSTIAGSLKDPALFSYCTAKFYELGPNLQK